MTTTSTSANLTFPLSTFGKLSPHPFLLSHLSSEPSVRPNGRLPSEFRPPNLNTGSLTHAEGSAVVRCGDTTAVAGVRGEILRVSDVADSRGVDSVGDGNAADIIGKAAAADDRARAAVKNAAAASKLKELDLIVPNIELATGCSPAFLPGQPPSTLAQALSTRLYTLLHESQLLDFEDLKIWFTPEDKINADNGEGGEGEGEEEGNAIAAVKAYWTLYIDILFISLDGNAFDIAWAAAIAALRNVRLPRAYWDGDAEMVLCSDDFTESKSLNLRGLPIACTFAVFSPAGNLKVQGKDKDEKRRRWILADPDNFEEGLCDESVTVIADCSHDPLLQKPGTKLLGISKVGGTSVGMLEMKELVSMAEKRWIEWERVLDS